MDKYEYKVRADEIKELIANGEYAQAAEIADTIDWRRVKSVMMLCTISDLYKINRRFEDAKNMLLLAYERRPGGRTICYALCELCIKTEDFVQAVNYYKEFVQAAPKDPGRYILQYKLYEAQDVSLEERISVLEELKKRDYREKWAYELAYLYHRVGLATKCVEECDELILWFGEGKYVIKAMELKMLHQPLDPDQQQKYDRRFEMPVRENPAEGPENGDVVFSGEDYGEEWAEETEEPEDREALAMQGDTVVYEKPARAAQEQAVPAGGEAATASEGADELDIHVKTMDMGRYNTMNLQAELAAGLREVLGDDQPKSAAVTRSIMAPMMDTGSDTESLDYPALEEEDIDGDDLEDGIGEIEGTEVFFGETGELGLVKQEAKGAAGAGPDGSASAAEEKKTAEKTDTDETRQIVMEQIRLEKTGRAEEQVMTAQPPRELADVLSQESDGQISLVIPERETVEKQITGQMNLQDVLAEWELLKQQSQERREEEVRQRVRQQTGNMFTEFEASVRDGLLEQLESGEAAGAAPDEGTETVSGPDVPGGSEDPEESPGPEEMAAEDTLEPPEADGAAQEAAAEAVSADGGEAVEGAGGDDREAVPGPEEGTDGEEEPIEREKAKARALTQEERELFAPYIQSRSAREQLVKAIDNISLAAYTGNIIITGDEGMDTTTLAKNMIREVQLTDSNFSGKVAKISGQALNQKDIGETLAKLENGALIIQKVSGMSQDTAAALYRELQRESLGIIVVLEDSKKAIQKLLEENGELASCFTARMNVEALSNDMLVSFGRQYAKELEYTIDDLGILALHTKIDELQTSDHAVTVVEVKRMVDNAVRHANKKTLRHFVDILIAKRYDEEDMIILTEKDFV